MGVVLCNIIVLLLLFHCLSIIMAIMQLYCTVAVVLLCEYYYGHYGIVLYPIKNSCKTCLEKRQDLSSRYLNGLVRIWTFLGMVLQDFVSFGMVLQDFVSLSMFFQEMQGFTRYSRFHKKLNMNDQEMSDLK